MGKKTKLIDNEEILREENKKFNAQIMMLKKLIDEKRDLSHFPQVIDKISEERKKDTELDIYALKKCFYALKNKEEDAYYYLSVLYYIKEKLSLSENNNSLFLNFKKTFIPTNERENIILRELEFLFIGKENVILPLEVEKKYNITSSFENNLILPHNFILKVNDINTTKAITIDASSDLTLKDDAISVKEFNDYYILGIHISDVSSFLVEGMPLEKHAKGSFRSLYLPDKVIHMLPETIAKSYLSLEQKTRKNVISLYLTINKSGFILKNEIVSENIEIEKNLTFLEAERIIRNIDKTTPSLEKTLKLLDHITYLLDGSYSLQEHIPYDEVNEENAESHRSMIIVQSCMVLYNNIFAKEMSKKDIPFIYRVHKKPEIEKIYEFGGEKNNLAQFFGVSTYSLTNTGHFGLKLSHYTHATSGIRRYMDYVSQKLYSLSLKNLSVMELKKLERDLIDLVEYANKKEKELRSFIPEYEYSYHKHFNL